MVSIEVRSMTENTCWEDLDIISEKCLRVDLEKRSRPFDFWTI